jgi:flagellar biosynthesis protein FlhG
MEEKSPSIFTLAGLKIERNLPEIISVTSGKGGVGKTFLSVNLAILLRQLKKKVLLIDADIHLGNVDLFLGIRPVYTIEDVVTKNMDLRKVIMQGPHGIDILPAASAVRELLENENNTLSKLADAFSRLEHEYDKVIVDTGAGIARNVLSFVIGADKIVVVVTPDPASVADAYGMIKVIRHNQMETPILLVTNMVESEEEGLSLFGKMNLMVQRFLNSEIIYGGAVQKDNWIARSIQRQQAMLIDVPNSVPSNALKMIVRKILWMPNHNIDKDQGFFDRLMINRNLDFDREVL